MINDYEATEPITSTAAPTGAYPGAYNVTNDDVISCLNGLIETCRDGQNGFLEASSAVNNSDIKSFFAESSQQRAKFVGELQSLVREIGGDPENSGSVAGAVHRGWIDLKAAIAGNDEHSVLVECERGEDYAKKAYKDALEKGLPSNVHELLMTQYQAVVETHNRVKELRDGTANSTADGDNTNTSTAASGF